MAWGKEKKEKYILKINKQLKRFCSLLLFLKFDFFPCFLWAVEQKCQSKREGGWCKQAWANGVKGGKAGVSVCVEVARRGGRGGERPRGCCYENSHKDRLNMIKGLAKLCKNPTGRKKTKKKCPKINKKNKKISKKRAKTRQSISARTKDKNVFKVKPWERREPWLQPDKSRQADEERSDGARGNERQQRTKAQLTQLCYHLYAGSTFFFLTEWNQWQ